MRDHEHQIAVAFMRWWAFFANRAGYDHRLLMAIPNGGHRHKAVAAKLKAEGVRAGVPDYFLAVARENPKAHGFWLELKTKTGVQSESQQSMQLILRDAGYQAEVAYGLDQAIDMVTAYMGTK